MFLRWNVLASLPRPHAQGKHPGICDVPSAGRVMQAHLPRKDVVAGGAERSERSQ